MPNSDPVYATYWLVPMFESGEGPLHISQRLKSFTNENIGLSSQSSLSLAINAYTSNHYIEIP